MHAFTLLSLSACLTLSGCSGHGLQDWADETFNDQGESKYQSMQRPSDATEVSPSEDQALNTISPSKTAASQGGTMQKSLDEWTEKEWTPAIEQNETIKMQDEDKDRPFTLQEYVDKAGVYIENKPKSSGPSHTEKLDKLPVIGE